MKTATTLTMDATPTGSLYLAIEQGERGWKLAFGTGFGQKPYYKGVPAGDVERVAEVIERAKKRFRLAVDAPVRSCYEAGREGFWLHRCLQTQGVHSLVVDSSSIEVNRRARRAKADRLDAGKLLTQLMRYHHGDRKAWSVVRVPSVSEEDARHLHRELKTLKQSRTRVMALKALGIESSWVFVMEFFAWRRFSNRRQVGSLAGLTPTPFQSGNSNREQGIGKDGNRHVRAMAVEIAWLWLRHQPDSSLSRWYERRFAQGGPRARRVGIVALARKLLIELWRYLESGALPEGAVTKA